MKEERKRAKKLMQEQSLPYNAWGGNLTIPIMTIVTVILSLIGFKNSFFSLVIFIAAIQVHRYNVKLKLGGRSYIAPIMVYVHNALSIPMVFLVANLTDATILPLLIIEVLFFAAVVVAFVFFFMTANQIKKQFPTMKADSLAARQAYQETIARLKNQI
ncbi:MAG: hypothetical protein IKD51_06100 [Lactococcus sp.]|nr:hypothetical protein [Lactococcus sp.]